jgi:hypothetical protein
MGLPPLSNVAIGLGSFCSIAFGRGPHFYVARRTHEPAYQENGLLERRILYRSQTRANVVAHHSELRSLALLCLYDFAV